MNLHPFKQSNPESTPRERRRSRSATLKRRARHITLSALSIAVLALALIITSMLATDSASAQTTNAGRLRDAMGNHPDNGYQKRYQWLSSHRRDRLQSTFQFRKHRRP